MKDNKFVFCALEQILKSVLSKAEAAGVQIKVVIHKVKLYLHQYINLPFLDGSSQLTVLEFWNGEGASRASHETWYHDSTFHRAVHA